MKITARILVVVLMAVNILSSVQAKSERPNVIFIITDDQRFDTISALGNPDIVTPNLDKLVNDGFVFRNTYCLGAANAAVCVPSRNMLLTGRVYFDWENKRQKFASGDKETFPKSMKAGGYETFHFGKGHGPKGNNSPNIHPQFDHFSFVNLVGEQSTGDGAKTTFDAAINFLNERDQSKLFFMYLAVPAPHDPRIAKSEWRKLYHPDDIPLPSNYTPIHPFDEGDMLSRDEKLEFWPRTPRAIKRHLHDYYAVISGIDYNVGRLMDAVKQKGLDKNTIFIYSSDQGLALGSHGLMGKQNLYEDTMKVPLVLSGAGIPHGESDAMLYLLDIFPTVCELTGAPMPKNIYGKSFAGIVKGNESKVRDTLCLSYKKCQRTVRDGEWKLMIFPEVDQTLLFNLKDDPRETRNLADNPEHAGQIKRLRSILEEWQKDVGDTAPLSIAKPKDPQWTPPELTPRDIMGVDSAGGAVRAKGKISKSQHYEDPRNWK